MAGYFVDGYFLPDYFIDDYFLSSEETPVTISGPTLSELSLASVFPKGELAWSGMNGGQQRKLSDGLAAQIERARNFGKGIVRDFYPSTTTMLEEWEEVYRLPSGSALTTAQRRARLSSVWKRISPASFDGINEIFSLSGFDVNIRPLASGEDPRDYPSTEPDTTYLYGDGRQGETIKNYLCVTGVARCGQVSESSRVGSYRGYRILDVDISIPDDSWTWGLIFVIESPSGGIASISSDLKDGFDFLVYKNKPLFMWAIARINWT